MTKPTDQDKETKNSGKERLSLNQKRSLTSPITPTSGSKVETNNRVSSRSNSKKRIIHFSTVDDLTGDVLLLGEKRASVNKLSNAVMPGRVGRLTVDHKHPGSKKMAL